MKVIFIGYRASGKTSVGRLVAGRLKIPFVDTDSVIEKTAGMPIKDLVAQTGWPAFRQAEEAAIASLDDDQPAVVATGGGAVLSAANRALLKKMGPLIYLHTPLADLIERLERDAADGGTRPPFTSGNLVAETVAVLKERLPLYESLSDFTVDTGGKNIVRLSEEIHQHLIERGFVADLLQTQKKLKK